MKGRRRQAVNSVTPTYGETLGGQRCNQKSSQKQNLRGSVKNAVCPETETPERLFRHQHADAEREAKNAEGSNNPCMGR